MFTAKELAARLAKGLALMEEDAAYHGPCAEKMVVYDNCMVISFDDGSEFRIATERVLGR